MTTTLTPGDIQVLCRLCADDDGRLERLFAERDELRTVVISLLALITRVNPGITTAEQNDLDRARKAPGI